MNITSKLLKSNESNFIFEVSKGVWIARFTTKEECAFDRMYFKTKSIAKKWMMAWCLNQERKNSFDFTFYPDLKECGKYISRTPKGWINEYIVYEESK